MKKQTFRKLMALSLALATMFLMAGCKKKEKEKEPVSSAPSSSEQAISSSGVSVPLSEVPVSSAPQKVAMSGVFININPERYVDERAPKLELKEDETFSLVLNLGDGLGEFSGTYERVGSSLTLTITQQETTDYLNSDIKTLSFNVMSEDHLKYTGKEVAMTKSEDQFTRDGIAAMIEQAPAEVVISEAAASGASASGASASGASASGASASGAATSKTTASGAKSGSAPVVKTSDT